MMKAAAITQARVVGALVLRETRVRYGQSRLGYLWALVEPAVYVGILSTMFTFVGSRAPFGNSMPLFFALGILPFFLFRNLANQLGPAFEANQALLSFPIVKELDTVIARAVLEIATSLFVIALILSVIVLTGDAPLPHSLLMMLVAIAGLSLLGFGIGLINAVVISRFQSWRNIFQVLNTAMLFSSGAFYSLESVPTNVRDILTWNPIIQGVEGVRDGYFMNYRASALDLSYLFWWGLVTTVIGLAAERAIRIRQS